uniref:Rab3 GTPase-activating protein catalytic subunit n=1 Tax=Heligmosomoides polygyrus TaxID=6339 RepID=A0A183FBV7_HELPZ
LASFHDAVNGIFRGRNVSLSDLGESAIKYDRNTEYEELLTKKMKDTRIDLEDVKIIEHRAKSLSQSSDIVVRELTGIVHRLIYGYVGTNIALDVCLRWCRELQQGMVKTNAQVTRACSAEPTLPKGHSLSSSNLSRNWRSLSTPPFKVPTQPSA